VLLLNVDVSLLESREITVLCLEPDELCEKRQCLVGSAHGNGASKCANYGNEAKYEIKYRYSFTNPPVQVQGCLRCLTMLTASFHHCLKLLLLLD
jgi:hypothetical protein